MAVAVYFDGLCEPRNPSGYACGGWHIPASPDNGIPDIKGHRYYLRGEGSTNNVAEYNAALDALRSLYATGYRGDVELYGDSKLVVCQVRGEWACNREHLRELRDKLRHAFTFFTSVEACWIPRESNAIADSESRIAYQQARRAA